MKKTVIQIMIATVLSKILGFLRDIVLSYFYGASNVSDAYLIALTVPSIIFGFIGVGLTTAYIPLYSRIEKDSEENAADRYTSNLINVVLIFSFLIFCFTALFSQSIVKIFAVGFKNDTFKLAVTLTRVSLISLLFTGVISIFSGYLQIKNNYVIPALIGIPLNITIIVSIILSAKNNILWLAIGNVIASVLQFAFLLPFVIKKKFKYKPLLDFKDKNLRTMILMVIPGIIGMGVNQINVLADRTIASFITIGGISSLNYANKLIYFIQGVLVMSISTALYPMISKMAANNEIVELKKTLSESINLINILVIPITVGAMIFSEPVIRLLYGRGAFDDAAIKITSDALFFYSMGILGVALSDILSRYFYSACDTKTPMKNSVIAMVMNIILNIILSKYIGIGGLALATSISATFCTILLFISLRKKLGSFGIKNIVISFIKILCASLVMGLIAKLLYDILIKHINANISLIIAIIIGAFLYFVIIYFWGIDEVDSMIKAMRNKIKRSVGSK